MTERVAKAAPRHTIKLTYARRTSAVNGRTPQLLLSGLDSLVSGSTP